MAEEGTKRGTICREKSPEKEGVAAAALLGWKRRRRTRKDDYAPLSLLNFN
jgi:hypothetical protein